MTAKAKANVNWVRLAVVDISFRRNVEKDKDFLLKDLQAFEKTAFHREHKMIALKAEVNKLSRELGLPLPYEEVDDDGDLFDSK